MLKGSVYYVSYMQILHFTLWVKYLSSNSETTEKEVSGNVLIQLYNLHVWFKRPAYLGKQSMQINWMFLLWCLYLDKLIDDVRI